MYQFRYKAVRFSVIILLVAGTYSKDIFVSPYGKDLKTCGTLRNPCNRIAYPIDNKIAKSNDVIKIDASAGDVLIANTINLFAINLTFTSYNGKARIRPTKEQRWGLQYFVNPKSYVHKQGKVEKFVKISILNLDFYNLPLVVLCNHSNVSSKFAIVVDGCHFEIDSKAEAKSRGNSNLAGIIYIRIGLASIIIRNCSFNGDGNLYIGFVKVHLLSPYCPRDLEIEILNSMFRKSAYLVNVPLNKCHANKGIKKLKITLNETVVQSDSKYTSVYPCISLITGNAPKHIDSSITIDRTRFWGITATASAAVMALQGEVNALIKNTDFLGNTGMEGGALFFNLKEAEVRNCTFSYNSAEAKGMCGDTGMSGSGGAFAGKAKKLTIIDSTFINNTAACFGGSVHAFQCKQIAVYNTVFQTKSKRDIFESSIWQSFSTKLILDGMKIVLPISRKNEKKIFLANSESIITGRVKPLFVCPTGSNIEFEYQRRTTNTTSISCTPCPVNTYSTDHAYGIISNFRDNKTKLHNVKCQSCPFGGVCDRNILPKQNFWGYNQRGLVHMISCPPGYCCRNADECNRLNACHAKRRGTLCGQCKSGNAQNIFTNECTSNKECNRVKFWATYITLAVVLVGLIAFIQDIFKSLFRMLTPKVLMKWFKMASSSSRLQHNKDEIEEDSFLMNDEEAEIHDNHLSSSSDVAIQNINENEEKQNFNNSISVGLIKIIFFYYQMNALLIVYKSQIHLNIVDHLHQVLLNIFNLEPNNSQLASYGCAIANSSTLHKTILKSFFPMVMLCVAAVLFAVCTIIRYFMKRYSFAKYIKSFNDRLLVTILQIILLGYSTMTSHIFSLLTCVPLADGKKILFIDGNINCYESWQYAALVFVFAWTLPLVYTLYAAPKCLERNALSVQGFYLALAFPLIFFIHSIFKKSTSKPEADSNPEEHNSNEYAALEALIPPSPNETEDTMKKLKDKLMHVLCGSFRSNGKETRGITWEPALIFQRLLLLSCHAFFINPVLKAMLMLFLTVLIAFFNIAMQPFHGKFLNIINIIFILFLCVSGIINSLHAYVYVGGTMIYGPLLDIISACDYIEIVTMVVFPVVACTAFVLMLLAKLTHSTYKSVVVLKSAAANRKSFLSR